MLNRILRFKLEKEKLTQEVKAVCQDTSIPLDERWEIFKQSELGDIQSWVMTFAALDDMYESGECDYYDAFGKDRYAYVDMIEVVEEHIEGWDQYEESTPPTQEQIDALKEEILEKFVKGFHNDW